MFVLVPLNRPAASRLPLSPHCSSFKHTVDRMAATTLYGSQLELGRRSSKYPHPSSDTPRGIRIDAPRCATPALKSSIELVSWRPVSRRSLSRPCFGSYARMCFAWHLDSRSMATLMAASPVLGVRVASVETLVWAPAPFQSPTIGFGSSVATICEEGKLRER